MLRGQIPHNHNSHGHRGGDPIPAHPYYPGQTVPSTAVYTLVTEDGRAAGREEIHEQGTTFPPTRGGNEARYKLTRIVKNPKKRGR
jgi:hypothetical protein